MIKQKNISEGLLYRKKRAIFVTILLIILTLTLCILTLKYGNETYSINTVIKVLMGEKIPKANFPISVIRLPKMLAGLMVGFSLAIAGNTFQTILRNSLASPDVIGISTSTSAAGIFCILVLGISGPLVSIISTTFGIFIAVIIYVLARGKVFNNNRLILVGIGVQTMMSAFISYVMINANEYDIPAALRWLNGSLNGVQMKSIPWLGFITILFGSLILAFEKELKIMELGEQLSVTLGVRTDITRVILIVSAVFLIAFSTSVTGPIAFVAFLSGPIAKRLVGTGSKNLFISGLVGANLVLMSEIIGQFAFSYRYPVGVITGVLGAPYLLLLIIQMNKRGGI